ncbi:MAG TPA: hypothetical protein VJN43_02015 [Bryobacteraceae bacterium]|nr:hypothetical protein [Bryobacteraceae bacterium]
MKPVLSIAILTGVAAFCAERPGALDYPLALKTRWTYHLRHENGPGVRFGDDVASLVKNNVLEATLVAEAAAVEEVGGRQYTRVETRLHGKPWLFEWERASAEGLLIGKTIDYQGGAQEVLMDPEQTRISANLRPGYFWTWQAKDAPVRFRFTVVGPGEVEVPAGHHSGVHLNGRGTVTAPFGTVEIRQDTWFVPGMGIARQETDTSVQGHRLSHVLLTLVKFEKP